MIEESKRRLKTDVLDLVQIHSLNGVDVLFPHLFELKKKGQIRYVGITTSSGSQHDADGRAHQLAAARLHPGGLFARRIAPRPTAVLPAALAKRVAVLINLPFGGRRDGNLFSRVAGARSARMGRGDRRDELGPDVPQVRGLASGGHGGDSGHDQARASRGQPRGAARPHAGRGDARAHGEILGSELRPDQREKNARELDSSRAFSLARVTCRRRRRGRPSSA